MCVKPVSYAYSAIRLFTNWVPLSETNSEQTGKSAKNALNARTACSASVVFTGNSLKYRVHVSIMTTMCMLPFSSSGNGPIVSTLIRLNGSYEAFVNGAVWMGNLIWDSFWHKGQWRMNFRTWSLCKSQGGNSSLRRRRVISTPPCPLKVLWTF